jgi:DNA-binding MarR family transcriptional regulator
MSRNLGAGDQAERIAAQYSGRYPWADPEALKLYYRLEIVDDCLRDAADRLHHAVLPGAKGWFVAILRVLFISPRSLSHAEISAEMRVPPANLTYQIDMMEKEGYVRRVPHETDRRVTLVELTDKGIEAAERLIPARARFITALGAAFSEAERHQFNDLLARLQQAITSYDGNAGPAAGLPDTIAR